MPSNHLILCLPLLLLPSIFPSIRVFSKESVLHIMWPKYWSFSISPSNEYSGLISFMIDWFDLLAVQGTFKSLLQHRSSKASILQCSAFFIVQLSKNKFKQTHNWSQTLKWICKWVQLCGSLNILWHCPSLGCHVVMYGCESWTIKKAEHWRIDAFELWC